MSEQPFGTKRCDVPGYEDCWVSFRTSGYPRKLRREWEAAEDNDALLGIVLRYVTGWNLRDLDGAAVPWPAELPALDNVEDAVAFWLIRAFRLFWLVELVAPRPNS